VNPSSPPTPAGSRRSLRLVAILLELLEEAAPDDPRLGGEQRRCSPGPSLPGTQPVPVRVVPDLTIGEILDRTRQAGFGFIAALLAVIAIPFVGLPTPFGMAVAFVGVQMIAGLPRPWLPRGLRRRHISLSTLRWVAPRLARWTAGLGHTVRKRFTFMVAGPLWVVCGVALLVQGLALALPLPIPGSHWIFIVPITLYGIGLLESDGLLILICHAITLVQAAIGFWLWEAIVHQLTASPRWLTG
jgi:hypothetical protein